MEDIGCIFCGTEGSAAIIEEKGYTGRKCVRCGLIYVSPRPSRHEVVDLYGHDAAHLTAGSITTSVQGGAGDGGNISIAGPQHVVLNDSSIQANAYGGDGGNIAIDSSYFIASPGSVVQASSQLGVSGSITVTAPVVDIGAGLGVLPSGFFDATRLLREACASRAGESENSFVAVGRGRLPESAWTALPSPAGGGDEKK